MKKKLMQYPDNTGVRLISFYLSQTFVFASSWLFIEGEKRERWKKDKSKRKNEEDDKSKSEIWSFYLSQAFKFASSWLFIEGGKREKDENDISMCKKWKRMIKAKVKSDPIKQFEPDEYCTTHYITTRIRCYELNTKEKKRS